MHLTKTLKALRVAGHPVIINIRNRKGRVIKRINVATDPNAPFYFRKQAYLMWLRIYSKYGSKDWVCKNFEKKMII